MALITIRKIVNPSETKQVGEWAAKDIEGLKKMGFELEDPQDAVTYSASSDPASDVKKRIRKNVVEVNPNEEEVIKLRNPFLEDETPKETGDTKEEELTLETENLPEVTFEETTALELNKEAEPVKKKAGRPAKVRA